MLTAMVAGFYDGGGGCAELYAGAGGEFYTEFCLGVQDMCAAHPCAMHGPATVRMVSNNATPPVPMPVQVPPGHMVQQIVDENGTLRHVILSPQPPPMTVPMGPTYGPGPTPNTGPGSPHFYPYPHPPPYTPHPHPQYHHPHPSGPPPPHMQPGVTHQLHGQVSPLSHQCNNHHSHQGLSPPPLPHHSHQDERTQKRVMRLRRKLENRQPRENNYISHISPPATPKKENIRKYKDRNTNVSGLEDGDENPLQDEEDTRLLTDLLSKILPPMVTEVAPRSALLRWKPPDMSSENGENKYGDFDIKESEFLFDVLLSERKDGKCRVVYSGSCLEYLLTDLKPATEYFVSLQAILDDLRGIATEAVSFKTKCCEPDAPLPPKVTSRTRNSLALRWNAATDNGSKITHYILESDEGKASDHFVEILNGPQKQLKIPKLLAATWYQFRLSAVNEFGRSKPSEVIRFSTSGSPPMPPLAPQLKEAQVSKLLLFWQKRPSDEEFTLQMEDELSGHGFLPVYNGKETQYSCCSLHRNTEYKFRLCANNDEGSSRWSDVVNYQTQPDKPGAPTKPVLKGRIQATCFKVNWEAPKDSGGSGIEHYILEMDSGQGFESVYLGLDMEFQCDHLKPGTIHYLRARCKSSGGMSEYSDVSIITTSPVSPGHCLAPRLHGKPKATTLHLKWVPPEYDGGSQVTDFEIDMTSPDNLTRQVYRGRDTDCLVAGLLPGRPYLFQVRAINKIGAGPWSEPLEAVSGAGAPDRPKEPKIVCKSPHNAIVSWEEPVNNGATITDFRLEWSAKEADFTLLCQGPLSSYEVKGLIPATQYNFRVQATNSAGVGPFSAASSCVTPPSSPGCILVSTVRCECSATSVRLSWQEPPTNGSDIISYNIDLGDRHPQISINNVTSWNIEDLLPETAYRMRIQAVNSIGVGPFSSSVKAVTLSLPPSPPRLECLGISHNSLKVKWGEGKNPDFMQYTLEMENKAGCFVPIYQGSSLSHKVTKLTEVTEYRLRIFATNDAGDGPYSEVVKFTTCKAPPPPLKAPSVSSIDKSSCVVEWQPAKKLGDDVILYQLQLFSMRDQESRLIYKGSSTTYRIDSLESKAEYCVRVGTVRCCADGQADLMGAFSPGTSFATLSREPLQTVQSKALVTVSAERKPLTDQQWAFILLLAFIFFGVLGAMLLQSFLAINNVTSAPT